MLQIRKKKFQICKILKFRKLKGYKDETKSVGEQPINFTKFR